MSLLSYLPPLPSPSPHFSSTDRNLTVANLHAWATQISVAFLPISFLGTEESPAPYFLPPSKSLVLTRAAGAGSAATGEAHEAAPRAGRSSRLRVQPSSWPFILRLELPSPPRFRCSDRLPGAGQVTFFLSPCRSDPKGPPFPLCQHTRAGWPLLPSVTLPCSEGAGVYVFVICRALLALSLFLT